MSRRVRTMTVIAGLSLATLMATGTAPAAAQPLTLEACVERALAQNPQMERARRDVERSRLGVEQATNALLPSLGFSAAFSRYTSVSPQRLLNPATNQIVEGSTAANTSMTYYTGLNLSQSLYNPSMQAVYRQAAVQRESAEAGAELQRQQLVLQVHQAYYGVLRSERNLEVARADVAYNEELLNTVRALFEMETRSRVDLLRQESALAQAQQRLISASNGLALARAELNFLMGEAPTAQVEVVDDLGWEPQEVDAEALTGRALSAHPSLIQGRLGVAASQASVQAAGAGRLPSVNLSGNYSWRGDSYLQFSDALSRDYTWSVGVGVSVPVFDAFRTRNSVQRARVEHRGAMADLQTARRTVERDVNRALLELEEAGRMLETARRAVSLAEEALRLSREVYRIGSGSLLELNASQFDLVNARYQEVQALFNLKVASAALDFATGSLR